MTRNVLVTGANGHLGSALVRNLVAAGYRVRASVRNPDDPQKVKSLKALGVEIVRADLSDPASLEAAMAGMDGVFQVAAIYDTLPADGGAEMIRTGTEGAANALRAAAAAGVGRVVLTSSTVTLGPVTPEAAPANEDTWVQDLHIPYVQAKTQGEREARTLARELGLDLRTVLPGTILGPDFNHSTPSTEIIEAIAKGATRLGVPPMTLPFIDVRDVAEAHRLAYENGEPDGRYIAVAFCPTARELAEAAHAADPRIPKPLMTLPAFMMPLLPTVDAISAKLLGHPQTMHADWMRAWRGKTWKIDNSRTREALGWEPKVNLTDSIRDTLVVLQALGRL